MLATFIICRLFCVLISLDGGPLHLPIIQAANTIIPDKENNATIPDKRNNKYNQPHLLSLTANTTQLSFWRKRRQPMKRNVFYYFFHRELRCLRHKIHMGLFLTFLLAGIAMLTSSLIFCLFFISWLFLLLLSSPRAESARAVTGRRCPHSGEEEDFLMGQLNFFTKTAVTPEGKVEKSIPRWEINRHAEG